RPGPGLLVARLARRLRRGLPASPAGGTDRPAARGHATARPVEGAGAGGDGVALRPAPPRRPPRPGAVGMSDHRFPFSAVVGRDEVTLALLLVAVDPAIGGVLLRGQKGSAKTTLARGLAALLADDAPFVELPVGATEDRVVGTIDLAAALTGGERRFEPGLL